VDDATLIIAASPPELTKRTRQGSSTPIRRRAGVVERWRPSGSFSSKLERLDEVTLRYSSNYQTPPKIPNAPQDTKLPLHVAPGSLGRGQFLLTPSASPDSGSERGTGYQLTTTKTSACWVVPPADEHMKTTEKRTENDRTSNWAAATSGGPIVTVAKPKPRGSTMAAGRSVARVGSQPTNCVCFFPLQNNS
jgi:hypothetical protein